MWPSNVPQEALRDTRCSQHREKVNAEDRLSGFFFQIVILFQVTATIKL